MATAPTSSSRCPATRQRSTSACSCSATAVPPHYSGIPATPVTLDLADRIIFKGLTVLGINGRRMFETWYQAEALVKSGRVDPRAVITHVLPYTQFDRAFELMDKGEAVKIVLDFKGDIAKP